MILYRTPGRSLTRPPRTSTIECSCKLWPSPGIYAVTSMPLDKRTRATLRSAELGFFGVMILTCKHTPRFCGHPVMAGCFGLRVCTTRAFLTSWLIVGIPYSVVRAFKEKDTIFPAELKVKSKERKNVRGSSKPQGG